jgi:hypothetical protein
VQLSVLQILSQLVDLLLQGAQIAPAGRTLARARARA